MKRLRKFFADNFARYEVPLAPERKHEVHDYYYSARTLMEIKNDLNVARWRLRMAANNGCDLRDMRDGAFLVYARINEHRRWSLQAFVLRCRRRIKEREREQQRRFDEKSLPCFLRKQAQ